MTIVSSVWIPVSSFQSVTAFEPLAVMLPSALSQRRRPRSSPPGAAYFLFAKVKYFPFASVTDISPLAFSVPASVAPALKSPSSSTSKI